MLHNRILIAIEVGYIALAAFLYWLIKRAPLWPDEDPE